MPKGLQVHELVQLWQQIQEIHGSGPPGSVHPEGCDKQRSLRQQLQLLKVILCRPWCVARASKAPAFLLAERAASFLQRVTWLVSDYIAMQRVCLQLPWCSDPPVFKGAWKKDSGSAVPVLVWDLRSAGKYDWVLLLW